MANRFNPLTSEETVAYNAIANSLMSLKDDSQHRVLKEVLLRYNRQAVKIGSVQTAAASSAARAVASGSGAPVRAASSKKRTVKGDPDYAEFLKTDVAKSLIAARDAVGPIDKSTDPEIKAQRAQISAQLRTAHADFLAQKANSHSEIDSHPITE